MSEALLYLVFPINPICIILSTAYCAEGTFRYDFKNRKAGYLVTIILALLTGIAGDIGYFLFPELETGIEGLVMDGEAAARLCGLLIHFIAMIFLLKGKVWKRFLVTFLSSEVVGCLVHIFESLQLQITHMTEWEDREKQLIASIILEALSSLLVFLFLFVIAKARKKNDNTPLPLPSMGVVTVFLLLVNAFLADDYTTNSEQVLSSDATRPILLLLILFTICLFFFLRGTRKERDGLKAMNKINEELVDSQTKFFEASAKADSDIRAMRHDMKNNVQVLMLLLANKEYDKMQEYLEEMSEGLAGTNVSSHTGDVIADAIIADKMKRATEAGLKLDVTGAIAGVEISPVNMCKMLGNLLDNAIEATSDPRLKELDSEFKVINLQFKHTENFFMISVTNPCAESPKIKDGKIVTSKSDKKNHGFGISNIRSAAEDCGGELSVSCEEKPFGYLFRAEVVI